MSTFRLSCIQNQAIEYLHERSQEGECDNQDALPKLSLFKDGKEVCQAANLIDHTTVTF